MSHARRGRIGRLPRWQRLPAYVIFIACAISGVAYFLADRLHLPLSPDGAHQVLVIHGIAAYAAVLAFGSLLPGHMRAAWNARRNRNSGVAMAVVLTLLSVSGLALYYGSEDMRMPSLWLHWSIGFALVALFPLHLVLGRRANARSAKAGAMRTRPRGPGGHASSSAVLDLTHDDG